ASAPDLHRQHTSRTKRRGGRALVRNARSTARQVRDRDRRSEGGEPAAHERAGASTVQEVPARSHEGVERARLTRRRVRVRHAGVQLLVAAVARERDGLPRSRVGLQTGRLRQLWGRVGWNAIGTDDEAARHRPQDDADDRSRAPAVLHEGLRAGWHVRARRGAGDGRRRDARRAAALDECARNAPVRLAEENAAVNRYVLGLGQSAVIAALLLWVAVRGEKRVKTPTRKATQGERWLGFLVPMLLFGAAIAFAPTFDAWGVGGSFSSWGELRFSASGCIPTT